MYKIRGTYGEGLKSGTAFTRTLGLVRLHKTYTLSRENISLSLSWQILYERYYIFLAVFFHITFQESSWYSTVLKGRFDYWTDF